MKFPKLSLGSPALIVLLAVSVAVSVSVLVYCLDKSDKDGPFKSAKKEEHEKEHPPHVELPEKDTWRFIVSGDSRNCGDVVMPTIAAHSAKHFQPSFYWHLGDLRAIYKVDEDMAFAGETNGLSLSCEKYLKKAWPDFIEHQIAPFGDTPFYIGIGNHEVIPPMNDPSVVGEKPPLQSTNPGEIRPELNGAQFTSRFADWLLTPAIKAQRLQDKDCTEVPAASAPGAAAAKGGNLSKRCLYLPRNYYHWIQGGVDFIYLDNASNVFGPQQLDWFEKRLKRAASPDVHSLVVGMHEALPDSISSDHAMCDRKAEKEAKERNEPYNYDQSCREGRQVYNALVDFQVMYPERHVYVLASHSHYYLDGLFNNKPVAERLHGWITGTAGATRNPLPPQWEDSTSAKTDIYGYLLGTVDHAGNIKFDFEQVDESDVPQSAKQRYHPSFMNMCFARNSKNQKAEAGDATNSCNEAPPKAAPSPAQ